MNNNILKITELFPVTCIYVTYGMVIGNILERMFVSMFGHLHDNLEKYNKKNIISIIIEIIFQMFIVAIVYFYSKILLSNIPIYNLISKEINLSKNYDLTIIFTFTFFSLQQNLEDKFIYLLNRINKYNLIIPKY
jgi:uncharacterized protein YacL